MHPFVLPYCEWLQRTPIGIFMRQSDWAFPTVAALHILGYVPLIACTSMFGVRLAGWAFRDVPVSKLAGGLLPWSVAGFVVEVVTGTLLFCSSAATYAETNIFPVKLLLILLAGINALVFLRTSYRRVAAWDTAPMPPFGARVAGCLSIVLWVAVLVMGRVLNTAAALVTVASNLLGR